LLTNLLASIEQRLEQWRHAEAVREICRRAAALQNEKNFPDAFALLDGQLARYPGDPKLLAAVKSAHEARSAAIGSEAAKARKLADDGRFEPAVATLKAAISAYPGEERLTTLLIVIEEEHARALHAEATRAVAAPETPVIEPPPPVPESLQAKRPRRGDGKNSGGGTAVSDSQEFIPPIPEPPQGSPPVKEPPAAWSVGSLEPPLVEPRPESEPAPARRRLWLIGGAALAVVGAIVLLIVPKGNAITEIRTTPAGAKISVGGQTCVAPDCRLHLAPGTYDMHAELDGFRPASRLITVTGKAAPPVSLALDPWPTGLAVSTDLESGRARLDGRSAGELTGGQWSLSDLSAGAHRLEIDSGAGRSSVAFTVHPGALPSIDSIDGARGMEVIAAGASGNRVVLRCRCSSSATSLDGKPLGDIRSGDVIAQNVAEGTHEIQAKLSGGEYKLAFTTREQPSIQVLIRTASNTGILMIVSNEDGASVLLNGNRYPRATSGGGLQVPLTPRTYSVTLEKPGFQGSTQNVTIERNGTQELKFNLVPLGSTLRIADGSPSGEVRLDGRHLGNISNTGEFSAVVSPGHHTVEIAKNGYETKRLDLNFEQGKSTELGATQTQLAQVQVPTKPIITPPKPQPPKPQPPVVHTPDAAELEAADWAHVENSRDPQALDQFRKKYPSGPHAALAEQRIEQLEWESTNQNDPAALHAYLSRYPNSPNAGAARAAIARIEQASRQAADLQGIQTALKEYESAYARRDLDALRAVWPTLPKHEADTLKRDFRMAKSSSAELKPLSAPAISGDRASVECERTVRQTLDGHQYSGSDRVRVALSRNAGRWVIDSVASVH
jgi:PEGA domain